MLPTAARPLVRQIASALNGASSSARNGIKSKLQLGFPRAETTTASAAIESSAVDAYSKPTAWVHWLMGAGILGCFGAVQGAMWTKDTKLKGELMIIHKSTGLGVAALVLPRIALAVMAKRPGGLPGSPPWEHMIAGATHYAMYAFMIAMPVSGIAMGYYGGKGMPFYGYFTIPGAEPANGGVAKTSFLVHKTLGLFFEYLVPMHIGAAVFHAWKGQKIFRRICPI